MHSGKAVKILYATQVSACPPTFVLFVNYPEAVKENYTRFLRNRIYEKFDFEGVPVRIEYRERSRRQR